MTSYSDQIPVTPGSAGPGSPPRRAPATLITEAEPSYDEQFRARRKRYLVMMSMRVPCLILATVFYQTPWLALLIILISIPLPWMAVLIANDRPARKRSKVIPGTINYERALMPGGREIVDSEPESAAGRSTDGTGPRAG